MSGQRDTDEESVVYYSTAQIVTRAPGTPDASSGGDLLALIKKKAPDPTIFDEGVAPFTWMAESSNSRLDSYFTRQDTQSLKNYTKDANDGVMFLDSHDKRQLGFGQSIRGTFTPSSDKLDEKTPDDKNPATVTIDFFTIPGVQLGRASSDSFIASVRSGVIRDVSIGFMPESFECNLCKSDPFDWWSMDCMHIPGAYYDSTGKNIVTKRSDGAVQAFAWVRNSRLLEVSAVYDGATPGAYVKKAQWLAEAGEVDRAAATILERQLRIHLPQKAMAVPVLKRDSSTGILTLSRGTAIIDGVEYAEGMEVRELGDQPRFRRLAQHNERASDDTNDQGGAGGDNAATVTPPPQNPNLKRDESPEGVADAGGGITSPSHAAPEDVRMTGLNEEQVRELQESAQRDGGVVKAVRVALAAAGVKDAETVDPAEAIRTLYGTITDLTPRAELGDKWRERVVSHALEAGVRAEGNDFDTAEWTETFRLMKPEQIERIAATWEAKAPDLSGGRRTAGTNTDAPAGGDPQKKATVIGPDAQFAVNGRR